MVNLYMKHGSIDEGGGPCGASVTLLRKHVRALVYVFYIVFVLLVWLSISCVDDVRSSYVALNFAIMITRASKNTETGCI